MGLNIPPLEKTNFAVKTNYKKKTKKKYEKLAWNSESKDNANQNEEEKMEGKEYGTLTKGFELSLVCCISIYAWFWHTMLQPVGYVICYMWWVRVSILFILFCFLTQLFCIIDLCFHPLWAKIGGTVWWHSWVMTKFGWCEIYGFIYYILLLSNQSQPKRIERKGSQFYYILLYILLWTYMSYFYKIDNLCFKEWNSKKHLVFLLISLLIVRLYKHFGISEVKC